VKVSETAFAVFDLETTGVDTANDRIAELGVCWFRPGELPRRSRKLLNPGVPIPEEASKIHGITDAMVADAEPFAAIASRLASWFAPPLLAVGYNATRFDAPMLDAELARAGVEGRMPAEILDPLVFVRWFHRGQRVRRLVEAAALYGIQPADGAAHSAAVDCQMTGELVLAMVKRGIIPDDVRVALDAQAKMQPKIEAEFDLYGYWLFADRDDGRTLRMGAGKVCGERLDETDPDYLRFVLRKGYVEKPAAVEAMKARCAR
jgi:DNA polymerase-3 subunit epsilon